MKTSVRNAIRLIAVIGAAALIAISFIRQAGIGKRAGWPFSTHAAAQTKTAALASAEPQKRILYWYDPMHPAYHSDKAGIAPDCGMALVPMYESKTPAEQASADAGLIHMPQSQQRALGVRLTTVEEQSVSRTLRTSGVVTADETRIAHVHVKTAGWVEEVYANFVGQFVRKGQALFTVYSPDLVATQQEYLIARRGQQQLGRSQFDEVAKSSQSLMESARERLKLWDLTDKQIAELDRTGQVSKTITVYSPVSGFITDRKAFPNTSTNRRYGAVHDCRPLARVGDGRCVRGRSAVCEGGTAGGDSLSL